VLPLPIIFDEQRWLAAQTRRTEDLREQVHAWLPEQGLSGILAAQVAERLGAVESVGRGASPGTFAMAMAESLGVEARTAAKVGLAAHIYWAAADVADDIDDQEPGAPTVNLACALLFLAQRALYEISPRCALEGARFGLRMAGGQALDLAVTDRAEPPDLDAIVADKAAAELEFFMLLACEAAGISDARLAKLAGEFGRVLQIFSDVVDVYVKPVSDDFAAGKWTKPLAAYWRYATGRAGLLKALDRRDPAVLARLRYEAAPAAREALADLDRSLLEAWNDAVPLWKDPAPFGEAVTWSILAVQTVRDGLQELEPAAFPAIVEPGQACSRALAYLTGAAFREEHRWGLFGASLVTADLFTTIFQAAAIRDAGGEWRPAFDALLRMRDHDGWRYYPHRREIAPDADDAGLILGYFADDLPAGVKEATVAQLAHGFHGAAIHTWLGEAHGDVEWTGDDCLASLANAVWGLMRAGSADKVSEAVLQRLFHALLDHDLASPFYEPHAVRFFVHRAMAEAAARGRIDSAMARSARALLDAQLQEEQRLGGNFGNGIVVNATAILAAAQWGLPIGREAAYWLAARQAENGAWPGEPVFMGPGVNMRPQRWGHEGLTTSWVLLALKALEN
jgi:hypothetical protein